jgi:murein DD-endopeptidase MepM/ murein hydrolase activator NlpD
MHRHFWRACCATTVLIVPVGLALNAMNARAESIPPISGPSRATNGTLVIPLTSTRVATASNVPAPSVAAPTPAVTLTRRARPVTDQKAPAKTGSTKTGSAKTGSTKMGSGVSYLRYIVESGDTLSSVGERYGVKIREIKLATGITKNDLKLGQVLRVPLTTASVAPGSEQVRSAQASSSSTRLPPGVIVYALKANDSISGIGTRYGVTEAEIIDANPTLASLDHLRPGSSLLVPTTHKGRIIRLPQGTNLLSVATKYRISLTQLVNVNGARDPRDLTAGALVLVPGAKDRANRARLENKRVAERRHAVVVAAQAQAKTNARAQAKAQQRQAAQAQAKLEAKREALRVRQRAAATRAQRASIRVIPDNTVSSGGGYRWPMSSFQITSGYGRRSFWIGRSNFHTGIDLAAHYGAPIYAAKSGYVTEGGWGKFGLNVRISTGRGVSNIYGHMSRIRVRSGEYVNRGELIGYEGCTGICTGAHLHFEVQVSGAPRNPLRFLP